MRVVSNWQEGIAEVGHSPNGNGLVKVLTSANEKTATAHISLEDAKLLRLALGRVIREIEEAGPVEPTSKKAPSKKSP